MVVSSFQAAKVQFQAGTSLLITDLKLGEYNGLHLAVRALAYQIPVLILNDPDFAVESEATKLGASCLATTDINRERVLAFVESKLPPPQTTEGATALAWSNGDGPAATTRRLMH